MDKNYFIDNLDRAIKEEWIKAYHQPLVRAASGRVSDEEAFSRWVDPQYGIFQAEDFIPALEEAHLTYKLDLYMVERVLMKMKEQSEGGYFVVPESVNISGDDFRYCDMVSEITGLIDKYGFSRDKLTVELSERCISSDMEYMQQQIERLRSEGIKVWMDDYGSGYASMLILLKMHFDLLKIDQTFVKEMDKSDAGKIIVTELVKTALALGIDTVAECVETKTQVNFLKEIGCTKLQGYYYSKPFAWQDVLAHYKKDIHVTFENPAETDYFEALGRVNLYDLVISRNDDKNLNKYFDTFPMVVFGLDDEKATFIRCNKSYRDFVEEYFPNSKDKRVISYEDVKPGVGYYSFNAVRQCAKSGENAIIDDRTSDGLTLQLFIRRVAVNPVTKVAAVAVAVLSNTDTASTESLTYNYVARALSEDYINLYFVDLDTDTFAEYTPDGASRDIAFKKVGEDFFNLDRNDFDLEVYPDDLPTLKKEFAKEKIVREIEEKGQFSLVTRVMLNGAPNYVSIKGVKTKGKGNQVIVGINNVDSQIKNREIVERAKEERQIYQRIGALTGNFIFIFTVDPETGHFFKYNPTHISSDMGIPEEGDNFFTCIIKQARQGIHKGDLDHFLAAFDKINVLEQIHLTGMFENEHRLLINGKPRYVAMRATITKEDDEEKLIVGIMDIDSQIRREQEYARSLNAAEIKANLDELTGIKNKHAYASLEERLNERIRHNRHIDFAVGVFDLNGLKQVNDTYGHQEGDRFIKKGCEIICRIFKHSPVFRVGGDEFAVIAQGYDYLNIDSLMLRLRKQNIKNQIRKDVVIAGGFSRYMGGEKVADVYKRADEEMYKNKKELKRASYEGNQEANLKTE